MYDYVYREKKKTNKQTNKKEQKMLESPSLPKACADDLCRSKQRSTGCKVNVTGPMFIFRSLFSIPALHCSSLTHLTVQKPQEILI